jgi:hypothetical protein
MKRKNLKGALIASAVCAMFATAAAQTADKAAAGHDKAGGDVKCAGINSCKGTGSCAGAGHACAGQNGCKGQGSLQTKSEKECTDKGGKVVAKK